MPSAALYIFLSKQVFYQSGLEYLVQVSSSPSILRRISTDDLVESGFPTLL